MTYLGKCLYIGPLTMNELSQGSHMISPYFSTLEYLKTILVCFCDVFTSKVNLEGTLKCAYIETVWEKINTEVPREREVDLSSTL